LVRSAQRKINRIHLVQAYHHSNDADKDTNDANASKKCDVEDVSTYQKYYKRNRNTKQTALKSTLHVDVLIIHENELVDWR
jgi:hypothetical protein